MASTVELKKPSTPPTRWLAFMKWGPTSRLPHFSNSTPSLTKDSSRALREGNRGDVFSEVSAFHGENPRPKSAVGTRDRRTSSSPTRRPSSAHPRLQRGLRAPIQLRGERWARPPQFVFGKEPPRGFPLRPPGTKLAGRREPRRGGPPCCPRCGAHPWGRPLGGRLGARGLPLRASMFPNGPVARKDVSPRPFVGMAPKGPLLLPRPSVRVAPRGPELPPRAGAGMAPIGSRLAPRPVAGLMSRWPRPPSPGFTRRPWAPMYAGPGRKPQSGRRVVMGPRSMVGRCRGRPLRPGMTMELRGELPLPDPEGPSPSADIPTAARSWMNALRNDEESAQPVPVSISTPKNESTSPTLDAALKSVVAKAESTSPNMPPWAKPYKSKAEGSAPNSNSGEIDGHKVSSVGEGISRGNISVVADDGGGGLDWLKNAISLDTKVASKPNAAVTVHKIEDESKSARVVGDSSSRPSATTCLESALTGEAPRDLDPPGAVNSNDWLSQAVTGAAEAGASRGSATKNAQKPEDPSVAPVAWMSAKLGLPIDEDKIKDGQSVRFPTSSSVVGAKISASLGTSGGWLSSGKLGVSVDDGEEDKGKTNVPPVVEAIKSEKEQKDVLTADKKAFPSAAARTSVALGDWLAQAVSSGVLGAPQNNDERESGDKADNRQTEASAKESSTEGRRRSSLDEGMPPWAAKPPTEDPSVEENIAKTGELSGGRPPWDPAPSVPVDTPAKEPPASGEKKKQRSNPPASVPPSALLWMTKMKSRSSIDLEDPEVEASIAEATAVEEIASKKNEEEKRESFVPSLGNYLLPRAKSFTYSSASVENVASLVPSQEKASATTVEETDSEQTQEEKHEQRVPSRLSFAQSAGLQKMEDAKPRRETDEMTQAIEERGKSSTGIQCGNTITGAPISVVGTTRGIQVNLGVECVEASDPEENPGEGTQITRRNG